MKIIKVISGARIEHLLPLPIVILMSSCNALSWLDGASTDDQKLSAARVCFDQGDFPCALNLYNTLTTSSVADEATSEAALDILASKGLTMKVFMNAILTNGSSGGSLITYLAGILSTNATESTRIAFFTAYNRNSGITNNGLKAFIRFYTSLALVSEIFAEQVGTTGRLLQTDLLTDPTTCITPFIAAGCAVPSGKTLTDGATSITMSTATEDQFTGAPTIRMVHALINEISSSLSVLQTSGGSVSGSSSSFANAIISGGAAIGTPTGSPAYRKVLITNGIGAAQ